MRKIQCVFILLATTICGLLSSTPSRAQELLTLEDCRSLAKEHSKQLHISLEKINAAHYSKKAAHKKYLPHVSAKGTYLRNQKELSILSDRQKNEISNLGPNGQARINQLADIIGEQLPTLKPLIQSLGQEAFTELNQFSEALIEGVRTDTRNMYVGAITLTQPLYMGGKIRAYNKITKYAENLAKEAHNLQLQDVILSVDQAYWQVVSLVNKEKLALSYLELLQKLDSDINHFIDEGMATRADGLSIRVKVNEGEMTLTKVQDGLALSRMLLCQVCGIDMQTPIKLADENITDLPVKSFYTNFDLQRAYFNRTEIKSLELATQIYDQKIKLARSEHLPHLALIGNYMVTNPAFYNGFEKKFRGMWNIGVSLSVPIWSWGEGYYKTKVAKSDAQIARLELAEAKEKIELQINQSAFKVNEANKKLKMASSNLDKANENLSYAKFGFEEGVIPVSNVLEAHTAWLSAQSEKIDAQIDIKLTEIYFNKALGKFTE